MDKRCFNAPINKLKKKGFGENEKERKAHTRSHVQCTCTVNIMRALCGLDIFGSRSIFYFLFFFTKMHT